MNLGDKFLMGCGIVFFTVFAIAMFWSIVAKTGDIMSGIFIFLVIISVLFIGATQNIKKKQVQTERYAFLKDEGEFLSRILQLVSVIIKQDEKFEDSEYRYIEEALDKFFPQKKVQRYMHDLKNVYIKQDYSLIGLSKFIENNYTAIERVQIMHLVIGIATADGLLTKDEYKRLKEIAIIFRIPFRSFESILGMFHFHKEWEKQKEKKSYRRSTYSLSTAYQVLELNENATVNQIKKAYRKLAVKHHPDKVIHMGPEFQKAAKEKFQKISDAYEYIKKYKGFS